MKQPYKSIADAHVAPRDYVQAFAKGLEIIRAFDAMHPRMTLTEVAAQTGFTPAATRRFLLTLVKERYALFDGKYFALAPRALDLGYAYLSSEGIWNGVEMALKDVSHQTGESCSGAVLDGDEVVYVARAAASKIMTVNLRVGSRLPAFYTSMGRVLLAYLPGMAAEGLLAKAKLKRFTQRTVTDSTALAAIIKRVRVNGYALVNQELELGLISIAVPLRDRDGRVTTAINVSTHVSRSSPQHLISSVLPVLQQAVQALSMERSR